MRRLFFLSILLFITVNVYPIPLNFDALQGKWYLKYKKYVGYEFRFKKNYRAYCIIYNGVSALVFKGIYSLEKEKLRININEMKNERKIRKIDLRRKFIKTSSSYFIFNAELRKKGKRKFLVLKPVKTIIDGNDSKGYFEKEVILKKFVNSNIF